MINVALKTPQKQDWESVFTTLHFRIGLMAALVSLHQAVPPHFTTKLRPWLCVYGCATACELKQKFALCKLFLEGTLMWTNS